MGWPASASTHPFDSSCAKRAVSSPDLYKILTKRIYSQELLRHVSI